MENKYGAPGGDTCVYHRVGGNTLAFVADTVIAELVILSVLRFR